MKIIIVIFFSLSLFCCNFNKTNNEIKYTNDILQTWQKYDGEWIVSGLLAYFLTEDPGEMGFCVSNNDKYIDSRISINVSDNTVTLNEDDIYKMIRIYKLSSYELSYKLFAPKWSVLATHMAREICGGEYYEEEGYVPRLTEGNPVTYIRFEKRSEKGEYLDTLSFIIADNGDLLVFIGECIGTYRLSRE